MRDSMIRYPGQGELNIWTLLPLDFNHAAINDDFSASYKTRIITCKKQNRLRKLDRLAHSLHRNDRVYIIFCAFKCLCIHTPSQDWICYWSRTYRIYTNALSDKLRCDHASERTHGGLTCRISTSSRVRHLVNDGAAKNAPFVLIANVLSKSSSLHSATVPRDKIPAFTKRMSIFPNFDLSSVMNASRSLRELTSPANPKESTPIVLSAESIVFPSLPMMATFAPSA